MDSVTNALMELISTIILKAVIHYVGQMHHTINKIVDATVFQAMLLSIINVEHALQELNIIQLLDNAQIFQ